MYLVAFHVCLICVSVPISISIFILLLLFLSLSFALIARIRNICMQGTMLHLKCLLAQWCKNNKVLTGLLDRIC